MDEQLEFLKLIASRLDSADIPYMITGSMAMAIYSVPRMTRDIDLVVNVSSEDIDRLVELFSVDCYIEQNSVRQAVDKHGMFNIIHNGWFIKADFIIRKNEEYRKEEFSRRKKMDVRGVTVSVVAPEDLILSKLAWAKQSQSDLQLGDVRQLIPAVPQLDWQYLQEWAAVLGVDGLLRRAQGDE